MQIPWAKISDALGLLTMQLSPSGLLNLGPHQGRVPYFGGSPVSVMHNLLLLLGTSLVTSQQPQQWGHTVCPLTAIPSPTPAV